LGCLFGEEGIHAAGASSEQREDVAALLLGEVIRVGEEAKPMGGVAA